MGRGRCLGEGRARLVWIGGKAGFHTGKRFVSCGDEWHFFLFLFSFFFSFVGEGCFNCLRMF